MGIFLSLNVIMIQSLAFAFGLGAVGLVYATARAVRGHDPLLVLVLAGVVVGSLLGAGFLLAVDTLARTVARIEIPLGVLTAFVGTPLFLWQLATTRRGWQ